MEGGSVPAAADTMACGGRRCKALSPGDPCDHPDGDFKVGDNGEAGADYDLEGLDGGGAAAEEAIGEPEATNLLGFHGESQGFGRRGRKALVPWRFQIGFKRSQSRGLSPDNGSDEHPGASKFRNGSRKRAPPKRYSAEVFPTKNRSGAQDQTGSAAAAAAVPKKKRITPKNMVAITRETLMASLQEFRVIYRNLLEEEKRKGSEEEDGSCGHDLAAFRAFTERFCVHYDEGKRYVGSLPGVQVGDVFDSNMELSLVGLHRAQQSSVDYIKMGRACLAVSVVSCTQHSTVNNNLDFLVHIGSMAATADQKMERTDMALKRSMDTKTHVRVIYMPMADPSGNSGQPENQTYYVYGGLYLVENFLREKVSEDRFITTFHLRRMPGQPHINIQELVKRRMEEPSNNGTFVADMSAGLEKIPISAINSISDEYPVPFRYISRMNYPLKNQLAPPSGCDCVGGCSNSPKCACLVKNGGKIPYTKNGLSFGEKPLVYECGPSCKCPSTCCNRVSQHGIKFRLQVFKTKSMGWGVRSLDFIPVGSFVCEYVGELLEDEDAEKSENDEYLFSIGHNYYNVSRWDSLLKTIPSLRNGPGEAEVNGFAVDGQKCGNFARFINHSCSPNLFSQNLLYDHDNTSMPHIALFADVDIPPLQPLSYHYNYTIDGVSDSDGNIKKKKCLCGSIKCSGWLY